MGIDATQIGAQVYQGSYANPNLIDRLLARFGFSTLVLCAAELQPDYSGGCLHIIRAPLDDTTDQAICAAQFASALRAARRAANASGRILVTCQAGLNRSGLVAALILWMRGAGTMADIINTISERRVTAFSHALYNPVFRQLLMEHAK